MVPRPQGLPGYRPCYRLAAEFLLKPPTCPSTAGRSEGDNHCQLRASRRLCPGPSKGVAKPPPRISLPRCSVRCRSWPSPFPPVRRKRSKRCANPPKWRNDAAIPGFAGQGSERWRVAIVTSAQLWRPINGRQGAWLCGFRATVTSMKQRTGPGDTFAMAAARLGVVQTLGAGLTMRDASQQTRDVPHS